MAAMTVALCAFALFLCASHGRRRRRWRSSHWSYGFVPDPVIQLENPGAMMLAGSGGLDGDHCDDGGSSMFSREQSGMNPVWKKNILMGGKCQLPDFSGVIIYDSDGNHVTPPSNKNCPRLHWK
ncbi:unnamed protein product [Linum tenue]|uniref:Uncharacterized protein n=1 Tax=Linum tenue TaxID=586396 RepID=A0AAV0RXA5_9ROSI|nr:unnamed protein product [Linum tenue]